VDDATLLERIKAAIEGRSSSAITGSIWAKIVIGLLGVAGAAVFCYVEWRRSQLIAKLQHEQAVRLLERANRMAAAANTVDEAAANKAKAAIDACSARVQVIDAQIVSLEKQHAQDKNHIDSIRSWNDLVGK